VFAGANFVLSVRNRSSQGFLGVRERCEREPELLRQGSSFVLYALMDAVVDRYFPLEHPRAIHDAAVRSGVRTDLWIERGFGHAESAVSTAVLDRIGGWARECVVGAAGSGTA